jgi:hypothetical protein
MQENSAEAKWLLELEVEDPLKGEIVWGKLAVVF